MEELYTAFLQSGAKLIGKVLTEGYTFDESKSVIDGKFCGLAIDEDNESELTDQRLSAWIQQINSEAKSQTWCQTSAPAKHRAHWHRDQFIDEPNRPEFRDVDSKTCQSTWRQYNHLNKQQQPA